MINHKKAYSILFITLAMAAISAGFFVFVFLTIKNKNQHSAAVNDAILEKNKEIENIAYLKDTIDNTKQKSQKLSSYLVDSGRVDEFVSAVESEGSLVGAPVTVTSVDFVKTKKNTISIEFGSKGTFDQMMHLATIVENMPYEISVKKVFLNRSISDPTKPAAANSWELQMGFEAVSN